uniref:NADH dehydrogenase [ubiquinone] 1 alpha subcomplex subunit 2 n=1 Tax=Parastrongyloides trichosuri TaxID=131310 RepID=A0A0N4ZR76_PARTI
MSAIRLGSGALRELRLHLCLKGTTSNGVRSFIENDYVALKKNNPNFPILIRESSGAQPKLWARFEKGIEEAVSLENLSKDDIMRLISNFASKKSV